LRGLVIQKNKPEALFKRPSGTICMLFLILSDSNNLFIIIVENQVIIFEREDFGSKALEIPEIYYFMILATILVILGTSRIAN